MPNNFKTFKYAFLGALLLLVTGVTAYQMLYAIPQKKCEDAHAWWSFRYRHCYIPVPITDLTGRHHKVAAGATPAAVSASPAATSASASAGHP